MKILELNEQSQKELLEELARRSSGRHSNYEAAVEEIIENVRSRGDAAVFEYTEKFDGFSLGADNICVTKEEIGQAYSELETEYVEVIKRAADNIRAFHMRQRRNSWFETDELGCMLGQRIIPLEKAGVYVPGGKAAYPSSVLMNVIPARVAGVSRIIMVTPPGKDGHINPGTLVAADIAGVDIIYKVGGAQAVAALAYGTESIPKVDKITGPGNIFVALAKKAVYGAVGIDSIAGPSEIMIIADDSANPRYIAADLLSQAEHDELASAILVTTSKSVADRVLKEIEEFTAELERRDIIKKSLDNYGYILVADSLDAACDCANAVASEHLEILTREPFKVQTRIRNAGAFFLGEYSSEPLGDYYAGPNHILPTGGTARFFSAVSVDDFIKKSSIIWYSEEGLKKVHSDIELFARREGLTAHENSIKVRFE